MKNAKISLVAQWDGWCGVCAAERPLVLTRTGRPRLRTWLTAAADDSRPLLLTCRLCGTGVDVPLERDDPPVVVTAEEPEPTPQEPPDGALDAGEVTATVPVPLPVLVPVSTSAAELAAGRQEVASVLGALLARRSAAAAVLPAAPAAPPALLPVVWPSAASSVPLQRGAPSGGLAELQLLADGIDLLSSERP